MYIIILFFRWNSKLKELKMCSIFQLYVLNKQAISTEFACFTFGVQRAIAIISKPFGGNYEEVV